VSRWTVDASVAIKWFVSEEFSDEAAAWLEDGPDLYVPELFFAEVPNVLWKKVTRGQVDEEDARIAHRSLRDIAFHGVSNQSVAEAAFDLALTLGRSAYDCFYLAVARAFEAPLVTADRRLAVAVRSTEFASRVRWVGSGP
jgi:predicted nucleic acid-binding protein